MDIKIYRALVGNVPYYWLVYQGELYSYFIQPKLVYLSTSTVNFLENLAEDITHEFIEDF